MGHRAAVLIFLLIAVSEAFYVAEQNFIRANLKNELRRQQNNMLNKPIVIESVDPVLEFMRFAPQKSYFKPRLGIASWWTYEDLVREFEDQM
ncbi:hypothetical protein L596_026797 [Steinernema carpocapsae]|uniref:Carboxypeptidase activation peptide domain-containing protein n=1 Tax=Steinernema carpocapsae TaxID=34508 RepID=A0A4V5ZY99_STECR|nr:hypothetical protein L596_026797 [Steinernema carpocapsae]